MSSKTNHTKSIIFLVREGRVEKSNEIYQATFYFDYFFSHNLIIDRPLLFPHNFLPSWIPPLFPLFATETHLQITDTRHQIMSQILVLPLSLSL